MRLSKFTSDAIKILVFCSQNRTGLIKVAAVAEEIGATKAVSLKLVNTLARLGYLKTVRGPSGGVSLADEPSKLTVGQIVRDLEEFHVNSPTDIDGQSSELSPYMNDALAAFLNVLDRHTIGDMAKHQGAGLSDDRPSKTAPAKPAKVRNAGSTSRRAEIR